MIIDLKKSLVYFLGFLFLIESFYFNIVYDLIIILLVFIVSLALGSFINIKVRGIDQILVSFSLGFGLIGYFIWLTSFYNFSYKSLYLILSFFMIYIRKDILLNYISLLRKSFIEIYKSNYLLFIIVIIFFCFYLIAALSPINGHDALTKHIAIPLKILQYNHYDYNIIESIVFGDYALLPHMVFTYILSLGGIKSIVIIILLISFLTLAILLRLSSFIVKDNFFINLVALTYLTVPLIFGSSTRLMVDMFPVFFIITSILIIQYTYYLKTNIIGIGLLFGLALFSKQVAAFIIIPLTIYILFQYIYKGFFKYKRLIFILFIAIVLALVIFLPPLLLVWYKTGNPFFPYMNGVFHSLYFTQDSFKDPFKNLLGFDFQSLYSIVFHTHQNIEMIDGGLGYYLLLLPFAILVSLVKRNKRLFLLIFIALVGYAISIQLTYNIRYFLASLILLIPVSIYPITLIKARYMREKYLFFLVVLSLVVLSGIKIFDKHNFWGFKINMLTRDERLLNNSNQSVLKYIPNEKSIKVLANNDLKRGEFLGKYYTLGWYNKYLIEQFQKSGLSPIDFLENFDYYLVDNTRPVHFSNQFNPLLLKNRLEIIAHSKTHTLYKIKKEEHVIVTKDFDVPIEVNVKKPKIFSFKNNYKRYNIVIEVSDRQIGHKGRFQINWQDKKGKFIGASISLFKIINKKYIYKSESINNIPKEANIGILYLTSSNTKDLKIKSFQLIGYQKVSLVDKLEDQYGEKFPYKAR